MTKEQKYPLKVINLSVREMGEILQKKRKKSLLAIKQFPRFREIEIAIERSKKKKKPLFQWIDEFEEETGIFKKDNNNPLRLLDENNHGPISSSIVRGLNRLVSNTMRNCFDMDTEINLVCHVTEYYLLKDLLLAVMGSQVILSPYADWGELEAFLNKYEKCGGVDSLYINDHFIERFFEEKNEESPFYMYRSYENANSFECIVNGNKDKNVDLIAKRKKLQELTTKAKEYFEIRKKKVLSIILLPSLPIEIKTMISREVFKVHEHGRITELRLKKWLGEWPYESSEEKNLHDILSKVKNTRIFSNIIQTYEKKLEECEEDIVCIIAGLLRKDKNKAASAIFKAWKNRPSTSRTSQEKRRENSLQHKKDINIFLDKLREKQRKINENEKEKIKNNELTEEKISQLEREKVKEIEKLEKEITNLKKQKNFLIKKSLFLVEESERTQTKYLQKCNQFLEYSIEVRDQTQIIEELQNANNSLLTLAEQELIERNRREQQLIQENNELRATLDQLATLWGQEKKKNKQATKFKKMIVNSFHQCQTNLAEAHSKIQTSQSEIQSLKEDKRDLENQLRAFEEEKKNWKHREKQLLAEIELLKNPPASENKENIAVETDKYQTEIKVLNEKLPAEQIKLINLVWQEAKDKYNQKNKKVNQLENHCKQLKTKGDKEKIILWTSIIFLMLVVLFCGLENIKLKNKYYNKKKKLIK